MIFNEGSAEFAEQIAKQNYLKPYSEFGELIFKQAKEQFILTGILEDDDGNESNGRKAIIIKLTLKIKKLSL